MGQFAAGCEPTVQLALNRVAFGTALSDATRIRSIIDVTCIFPFAKARWVR
jgi:hypothetical protein